MIRREENYDLSKLNLSDENPRQIKKKKFEELRGSLKRLPEMQDIREIVIDENDKVWAGHQRIRAMLANGQKTATVKRMIGWTEEEKREFMIADNVHSGEWDSDIIANQWDHEQLESWGRKSLSQKSAYTMAMSVKRPSIRCTCTRLTTTIWPANGRCRLLSAVIMCQRA